MAVVVEVVETGLVPPSEETPKGRLWLSNLDIPLASRHHTPLIYVYRPNGDPDSFNVETLRAALSRALVPFYPIAGRLVKGQDGRFEINCTGEGVMFVVARCESSAGEFGEFVPSAEMRELFVPAVPVKLPTILFMVQVSAH